MTGLDFSVKSYNGRAIRINPQTRYVCLTDMAAVNGKQVNDWMRLKGSNEYIQKFSVATGIAVATLLHVGDGTTGTWAHPKIALRFAQWCSIEFAIQVDMWIDELLTTGKVELAPQQPKLPSRVLAVETAEAIDKVQDLLGKNNPRLAQALIDCAMNDVVELTRPQLPASEFPDDRWYGLVQIADKMGIKTNLSTRAKLGQHFTRLINAGKLDVERVREERLCNGQMEPIWCYRDNDVVRDAIQQWADSIG